MVDHSRRALFRGRFKPEAQPVRPPWAIDEFLELCSRCDACIKACEEEILIREDSGYPMVDFTRGGCSWCQKCISSCETGALNVEIGSKWQSVAHISGQCLSANGIVCRACGDACDKNAILFQLQIGGRTLASINTESCDGCGFCIAVCPEQAIELKEAT